MDGELYEGILEDELMKTLEWFGQDVEDIIFQHDNDPKHTCKRVKNWFKTNNMEVLQWPAQSPDLNPIEHFWYHLKKQVKDYKEPAGEVTELWERIEKRWEEISQEKCQRLIESMPRRIRAVIKANGGYTKY